MALPRRAIPSDEEQAAMAKAMTERLRRVRSDQCSCRLLRPEVVARGQNPCITDLRPVQGWYLYELAERQGAAGFIEVGGGKTALDILAPMVFPGCKLATLLIRPGEVAQFVHDYKCWSQHFQAPNLAGGPGPFVPGRPVLEVFPYSHMPLEENAHWFKSRQPDLIIADEAQLLKDRKATRTGRFLRYFAEHEDKRFCCHSGSLTTRGVQDFSHLLALALRESSPMPLDPDIVDAWGETLNPAVGGFFPSDPGKLRRLCEGSESPRQAVHRRIVETRGVITTKTSSVTAKLVIRTADAGEVPEAVRLALKRARSEELLPDGNELVDQLEVAAACNQLAAGFYYRYKFPKGEPEPLILDWFKKRSEWSSELRERLQRRTDGMDSPKLVRDAAIRYHVGYKGPLPVWASKTWPAWAAIREKVEPETEAVWIDDFLVRAAAAWAAISPGIVWYGFDAFGVKLAKYSGLKRYGGGKAASEQIIHALGGTSIIASIKAHGTGKNLQSFSRMLVANPPADGGAWEQMIGRCHRYGQPKDEVQVHVFQHTAEMREALEKAKEYARYIQALTGNPQRLLYADTSAMRP